MSKPATQKTKSKTVKVYNHTSRMISCMIPQEHPSAQGQRRPHRIVKFMAGNNDCVLREDWEACMRNPKFVLNTVETEVRDRVGKKVKMVRLELGKTDRNQSEDEVILNERLEEAREEARVRGA